LVEEAEAEEILEAVALEDRETDLLTRILKIC